MTLPKVVYENLPYLYFIISGALMSIGNSWPLLFSAAIFYCVACIVLVARSAHRRKDKQQGTKGSIPELIYEYLPYSYIAIGIFGIMGTDNGMYQFATFIVLVWGLRNLMCRHSNRTKPSSGLF